jgi:nicotinamidase-related amidase
MPELLDRAAGGEIPLVPDQTALLFIDVQNYAAHRQGGEFRQLGDAEIAQRFGAFFDQLASRTLPNMRGLQAACRAAVVEVVYTVIDSLSLDGRDRSLDYRRGRAGAQGLLGRPGAIPVSSTPRNPEFIGAATTWCAAHFACFDPFDPFDPNRSNAGSHVSFAQLGTDYCRDCSTRPGALGSSHGRALCRPLAPTVEHGEGP